MTCSSPYLLSAICFFRQREVGKSDWSFTLMKRIAAKCVVNAKDKSYLVAHNLNSDRRGSAIFLFVTMLQY